MRHNHPGLSTLFIGAERINHLLNEAEKLASKASFPPFNVEQIADDHYQITLAVAGFKEAELDISVHQQKLIIKGAKVSDDDKEKTRTFIHKGIANRSFTREFALDEHVEVVKAHLEDGLLVIALERKVPESAKPKQVPIG